MNHWNTPLENQLTAWLLRRTAPTGVRRVAPVAAAVASEIGNVRGENQDRAAIAQGWDRQGKKFAVAVVADGIGGMRDGATCAALALGTFIAVLYQSAQSGSDHSEEWIHRAVTAANQAVFSKFRGEGGSTLVAVLTRSDRPAFWLSVGDSRVYRSVGNKLTQISVDDTIAGQLGKNAKENIEQSKLLQFIGMGKDLEPHIDKLDGEPADAVILTTDGVHYLAPAPGWLGHIVGNSPDPGTCVKRLVDLAKWCGGPDNATVAMMSTMASRDFESEPSYECLEVWDAFGELQVIAEKISGEPSKSKRQPPPVHAPEDSAKASIAATPVVEPSTDVHQSTSTAKARSDKNTSKTKSATVKKGKTKTAATKVPQLLMNFPNKTN